MDIENKSRYWEWFKIAACGCAFAIFISLILATSAQNFNNFCWSTECLNFYFFNVLKLPVAIITLSIPILGILLVLHRSHQTERQIKLNELHNTATNYFMHKRDFDKVCETIEERKTVYIDRFVAYQTMFPENYPASVKFSLSDDESSLHEHIFPSVLLKDRVVFFEDFTKNEDYSSDINIYFRLRCLEYILIKLGATDRKLGFSIEHPRPPNAGPRDVILSHNFDCIGFPLESIELSAKLLSDLLPNFFNFSNVTIDKSQLMRFFRLEVSGYTDKYLEEMGIYRKIDKNNLISMPSLSGWKKDVDRGSIEQFKISIKRNYCYKVRW